MIQTAKRKIVSIGNSRGVTFPHDVKHLLDEYVHLIYHECFILILRQEQGDLVTPEISEVAKTLISLVTHEKKVGDPKDPSGKTD